jgi:uncharacterized membrane protein (UPF0127 family)
MKRKILLITFIPAFLLLIVFVVFLGSYTKKQNKACFRNYCFEIELAITPAEMSRGLMFREKLDYNKGMLFVFGEEGKYRFWMKNTLIPLDIIWINKNGEVVFVSENALPCKDSFCPSIEPTQDAKYVLEVNGGTVGKIGLGRGDKMNIDIKSFFKRD